MLVPLPFLVTLSFSDTRGHNKAPPTIYTFPYMYLYIQLRCGGRAMVTRLGMFRALLEECNDETDSMTYEVYIMGFSHPGVAL